MAKADKKADTRAKPSAPRTKSDRTRAGAPQTRRSFRERISQRMMSVGFMRRRYVKRMLKYMDKSKEKGRRLTPELWELQRFLAQVPKEQRAEKLEAVITAQGRQQEPLGNRDLRRASVNQSRHSGKGANRYRPGMPARSLQQGPRVPKKPR